VCGSLVTAIVLYMQLTGVWIFGNGYCAVVQLTGGWRFGNGYCNVRAVDWSVDVW